MFMSAAHTLARDVSETDLAQGSLYPALPRIREVSANIAAAVADVAYRRGLGTGPVPTDVAAHIRERMYDPQYDSYV
jgi:malate dehydrogenase (oxaloacetate-decarboxylating)(NADP+)